VGKFVRTEKWIAVSLTGFAKPLSLPEKTVISEYAPVAVAGLIAILLAAALLLFVTTYAIKNRKRLGRVRSQIMLYSLFSAATLMVALLSVGAFYYLTLVYGGETTLNMFAFEIPKAGGAAVVIDGATAYSSQDPAATKQAMIACGNKIADALSGFNAKVYYIEGANCEIGGGQFPYADCDREFSELPVIYVRHGQKNLVSFRTLYAVNATLEGGDDWLNACHLAGALR
jgi:hypothetical protein